MVIPGRPHGPPFFIPPAYTRRAMIQPPSIQLRLDILTIRLQCIQDM